MAILHGANYILRSRTAGSIISKNDDKKAREDGVAAIYEKAAAEMAGKFDDDVLADLNTIIHDFEAEIVRSNILDKGTVLVNAEAPFSINVFQGPTVPCTTSPCEVKLRSGEQSLIIEKEGYRSS